MFDNEYCSKWLNSNDFWTSHTTIAGLTDASNCVSLAKQKLKLQGFSFIINPVHELEYTKSVSHYICNKLFLNS